MIGGQPQEVTVVHYSYTLPMAIFVVLGGLALVFAVLLKAADKKKEHGLALPNQR